MDSLLVIIKSQLNYNILIKLGTYCEWCKDNHRNDEEECRCSCHRHDSWRDHDWNIATIGSANMG